MRTFLSTILIAAVLLSPADRSAAQVITTYAGTGTTPGYSGDGGPATDATLNAPSDIALDASGNLIMADFINNVIRMVDASGNISTIAGTGFGAGGTGGTGAFTGDGGPATAAELNGPFAVIVDPAGNILFADGYNHVVRKISTTGTITTIAGIHAVGYAGDGGPATMASLNNPVGLALDKHGNLYIADDHNRVIRKVDAAGNISTFAGNHTTGYSGDGGQATDAALSNPIGVATDTMGNLYIADTGNVVRKVNTAGIISTFAGTTAYGYSGDGGPATAAQLRSPERVTVDDSNNVYISDFLNNVIRKVDPTGIITTIAGDGTSAGVSPTPINYGGDGGPATAAQMTLPCGVAINHSGIIYIADRGNDVIRRIGPADTVISAVRGPQMNGAANLSVFPNPSTSGYISISLLSTTTEPAEVIITNVLGETVKKLTTTTNKRAGVYLDSPAGIYLISATTAHGKWNSQVAIE